MMLSACGDNKVVPVVDAGGTQLPGWPRFMEPKPLPTVEPAIDARTAWVAERADNKVCRSQLVRGKSWYRDLAADLSRPAKEKRK